MPLRPSSPNRCPRCGGCLPDEGPSSQVCRCGTRWGPPLRELIRLLDEALSDPGPPDPPALPVPDPTLTPDPKEQT